MNELFNGNLMKQNITIEKDDHSNIVSSNRWFNIIHNLRLNLV